MDRRTFISSTVGTGLLMMTSCIGMTKKRKPTLLFTKTIGNGSDNSGSLLGSLDFETNQLRTLEIPMRNAHTVEPLGDGRHFLIIEARGKNGGKTFALYDHQNFEVLRSYEIKSAEQLRGHGKVYGQYFYLPRFDDGKGWGLSIRKVKDLTVEEDFISGVEGVPHQIRLRGNKLLFGTYGESREPFLYEYVVGEKGIRKSIVGPVHSRPGHFLDLSDHHFLFGLTWRQDKKFYGKELPGPLGFIGKEQGFQLLSLKSEKYQKRMRYALSQARSGNLIAQGHCYGKMVSFWNYDGRYLSERAVVETKHLPGGLNFINGGKELLVVGHYGGLEVIDIKSMSSIPDYQERWESLHQKHAEFFKGTNFHSLMLS